jgi:Trp operon repressor
MGKNLQALPRGASKEAAALALMEDERELRELLREGVAAVERATETLATTTPQLEAWLTKAKAVLL